MKAIKIVLTVLSLIMITVGISGCSTLHTTSFLLGDVPLPFGRMHEGDIYYDNKRRFIVECPVADAVVQKGKYGVSFVYMNGMSNYDVLAYPPEGISDYQFTLETMMQGTENYLKAQKFDFHVELKHYEEFKGYQAVDFHFWIERKGMEPRIYVTRLVKTKNYIYWLKYSNVILFNKEVRINEYQFKEAYEFFDTVQFEDQIPSEK